MLDAIRDLRGVRAVVPAALILLVITAVLAQINVWLGAGGLVLGGVAIFYAIKRRAPAVEPSKIPHGSSAESPTPVAGDSAETSNGRPPGTDELDWVIFKNLKSADEPRGLGRTEHFRAKYFVDLREACLVASQREFLAGVFADHIRERINPENFHVVAVPKSGNVLLAVAVAEELDLAPLVIRDWPIYGRRIETVETSGRALLLDDVWAEGDLLVEVVEQVREAGFILTHAFLFIERSEGNVAHALKSAAISHFSAIRTVDDDDLASLVAKVRRQ